jgi:glycosyltransferase involved in cell wall biosynthesis
MTGPNFTIVLPAKNEARALRNLLPALAAQYPEAEIIVVNDGSTDETAALCDECGVTQVRHPYSIGNGGAIKSGARAADTDVVVFMDADDQHDPKLVGELVRELETGIDMVVGARSSRSHAGLGRRLANALYNCMASWMTGQPIPDLTSGLRAVKRSKFLEFIHLFPNGFSYPTTVTMAFFRAGYSVAYYPIEARPRVGRSHILPLKDGVRFLLIIFKIGTLYSPLKLFLPISGFFALLGGSYYLFTYATAGRFTNMSALLLTTSVLIFLIGLVSEQITALYYSRRDRS